MMGLKLQLNKIITYIYQVIYFTGMEINRFTAQRIYKRSSHANNGSVPLKILHRLNPLFVAGPPDEVKKTSGRIVTFTLHVMSFVLFAAYSASLTSSLAVQLRDMPFRDLQGLLYDGSYKLGVLQNTVFINIFDVC